MPDVDKPYMRPGSPFWASLRIKRVKKKLWLYLIQPGGLPEDLL